MFKSLKTHRIHLAMSFSSLFPYARKIQIFNNNNLRILRSSYNYSTTESVMKLKEKIKVVDSEEMGLQNAEQWAEQITFYLEKENFTCFNDSIEMISKKNIILNLNDMNKLLSLTYNKNRRSLEIIYNYIEENNIQLDSLSFYYLIMSALEYNKINCAYNLFVEASIFKVPQNLSVIIGLYSALIKKQDREKWRNYKLFIDNHLNEYYPLDVIK